jgi:hypothetical protein
MNVKQKEKRLIIALMLFVLISLLFFSSVAFGQLSDPLGGVYGSIYYNDGKPLPLNDKGTATDIMIVNKDTNQNTVITTNDSGFFSANNTYTPGNYTLYACYKNTVVGSSDFNLTGGSNIPLDLTTSRMSTN